MLKAAIFDLDGTLIETEHLQYGAWAEVLRPLGVELGREEYVTQYAGKVGELIEAGLAKKYGLETAPGSLLGQKEEMVLEFFKTRPLKPMPYAREAVDSLASQGLKLAVATTSPRGEARVKLQRAGLYDSFYAIAPGDEVENAKPHPDLHLLAMGWLGAGPEECIAFEDSRYGVEAAKAAGITCLAVPSEYFGYQDLSQADKVFKDLREAVGWAKKEYKLRRTSSGALA
ncbi:MAG: HAD family hydrolase [Candidatus Aenigmatarchaeota archaeon]